MSRKIRSIMPFTITTSRYCNLWNNYAGICTRCGHIEEGVEPEEFGHRCSKCGKNRVMGIDKAVYQQLITIDDGA